MRGHAVPTRCPRCGEVALPAPDQRLVECHKCRLGYDWVRQADSPSASTGDRRGEPPMLDPPAGVETRRHGETLILLLPTTRARGAAMLAVGIACGVTAVAMLLASNVPFTAFLIAFAVGFTASGIVFAFTRRRFTVTPTDLRVDRIPFGGASAVIPVRELRQLAIARTRRGRQVVFDTELFAQLPDRDVHLLTTRDPDLAHYIEERIEFHLGIADDGVEMVVPGAE